MNLEPAFRDIESLKALAQNSRTLHDSIRGLASIARAHVQPI